MPKMQKPTATRSSGGAKVKGMPEEAPRGVSNEEYASRVRMATRKPKNAITVTFSEMDSYRQCPLKHKWSYKDGWREPAREGSALTRGSLYHEVMEAHYTLIQEGYRAPLDEFRQFMLEEFLIDKTGHQSEDQEIVEWMYDGYLECYGLDDDWEPVLIESAGEVRLRDEKGKPTKFYLRFKIDLVVRDRKTGHLWLVDHKSASNLSRETEIDMQEQFRLYAWALRQLDIPIAGIIRSDARTKRNKTPMKLEQRFRRVTTFMSDEEGDRIALDLLNTAKAAYSPHTPVYAAPMPDMCSWRCPFLGVHLAWRRGLADEDTLMRDFGLFKTEEKHREYADGPVATAIRQGRAGLPGGPSDG